MSPTPETPSTTSDSPRQAPTERPSINITTEELNQLAQEIEREKTNNDTNSSHNANGSNFAERIFRSADNLESSEAQNFMDWLPDDAKYPNRKDLSKQEILLLLEIRQLVSPSFNINSFSRDGVFDVNKFLELFNFQGRGEKAPLGFRYRPSVGWELIRTRGNIQINDTFLKFLTTEATFWIRENRPIAHMFRDNRVSDVDEDIASRIHNIIDRHVNITTNEFRNTEPSTNVSSLADDLTFTAQQKRDTLSTLLYDQRFRRTQGEILGRLNPPNNTNRPQPTNVITGLLEKNHLHCNSWVRTYHNNQYLITI
jgi:hypothetical protein